MNASASPVVKMKYATRDGSPSSSMITNGSPELVVLSVARGRNVRPGVTVMLVLMYSLLGTIVWPGPLASGARPLLLCGLRGLVRGQDDGHLVGLILVHGAIVVGLGGGPDLVHGFTDGHDAFTVSGRCRAMYSSSA